jgi:CRP-like cAMP-binding protein
MRRPLRTGPFRNSLLRNLDAEIVARLRLLPVSFDLGYEIEFPGKSIDALFFVEAGMASMTTTFEDGSQVEVGMFGHEAIIGVSALMGTKRSLNRVYTQIAGHGYSCPVEVAQREFSFGGAFQMLALRYVQTQLVHATQSAGCNAKHSVEQRLARWLLLCADRVQSSTYEMSHGVLADMLGSSRPTVSITAGLLKGQGLIAYRRGVIHILDIPRLERMACECYPLIKNHLGNYNEFDSGVAVSRPSLRIGQHQQALSNVRHPE